jgi:hypothetical protein
MENNEMKYCFKTFEGFNDYQLLTSIKDMYQNEEDPLVKTILL